MVISSKNDQPVTRTSCAYTICSDLNPEEGPSTVSLNFYQSTQPSELSASPGNSCPRAVEPTSAACPDEANSGPWNDEERNNLFYLSQIFCDRRLMALILNRTEDHIYSKLQKHITLLEEVYESISQAIKATGISTADPQFAARFKEVQATTLRLNEAFHRYLRIGESMSQFLMFGSPNKLIQSRFEYVNGQLEDQLKIKSSKRVLINRDRLRTKHDSQKVLKSFIPAYISRHVERKTGKSIYG